MKIHDLGVPLFLETPISLRLKKASFLFLDEATSALDNTSEKMIQQTIATGRSCWFPLGLVGFPLGLVGFSWGWLVSWRFVDGLLDSQLKVVRFLQADFWEYSFLLGTWEVIDVFQLKIFGEYVFVEKLGGIGFRFFSVLSFCHLVNLSFNLHMYIYIVWIIWYKYVIYRYVSRMFFFSWILRRWTS